MKKWIGAVCLIFSCALLGLRVQREPREEIAVLREMRSFLERMRTEIVRLHTPMPVLLDKLCRMERFFRSKPTPDGRDDFEEQWRAVIEAMALEAECRAALCDMGLALARGEDCGKAVDMASEVLEKSMERKEKQMEQRGRVPAAVGLCSGVLLAVLLL